MYYVCKCKKKYIITRTIEFRIDAFLFVLIGGFLELIAYIVLWPAIEVLGRKTTMIGTFGVTGASLVGVTVMQAAGYDGGYGNQSTLSSLRGLRGAPEVPPLWAKKLWNDGQKLGHRHAGRRV